MIKIKKAKASDVTLLALLGRLTWNESHGPYIEDKNDLLEHLNTHFSVAKTKQDFDDQNNLMYIAYANDLPIGYAKIILNVTHKHTFSSNSCRLERIFILNDFRSLKIGQQLLCFVEEQVKKLQLNTIWLSTYIKNNGAIRFYEKNDYENLGSLNFVVNDKSYENFVFSKSL